MPSSALTVAAAGSAIALALSLYVLIPNGMDPTIFLALGDEAPVQTRYAQDLLGEVSTRQNLGHDGRFFFPQANDPWYFEPERHAIVLDRPIYRAQRMLFPMIAGGLGLFPPQVVAWSMLVTNLLAMGIGAFLAAQLAVRSGASPWLGLTVPLNIGLIFELDIGGAGVVAYAFALGALYALARESDWAAALLFAASALAREVMIAFAVGVFVLGWLGERRLKWRLVIVPLLAMAVWYAFISFRLADLPDAEGGRAIFAPPFVGVWQALRSWIAHPGYLALNGVMIAVVALFSRLALRSRLPIAWGALPFVALSVTLSVHVWREPFDLARALAPVFTAIPFLVLVPGPGPHPARQSQESA